MGPKLSACESLRAWDVDTASFSQKLPATLSYSCIPGWPFCGSSERLNGGSSSSSAPN